MSFFKKLKNKTLRLYQLHIAKNPFYIAHKKWFKDDGDNTLRLDYPLNKSSIVFDVGAYEGQFTQSIFDRYGSKIFAFEPIPEFVELLEKKFSNNDNVQCFSYGLSDKDEILDMSIMKDSSSTYKTKKNSTIKAKFKDITNEIESRNLENIDLMKINIEGGEYSLLPRLISSGLIGKIDNLQIQFHDFFPEAKSQRESIRSELSKTHELTYEYYFIWENWKRK